MRDSGLYLHVPFCEHKCGYCDFNSWAETRKEFQIEWQKAMLRQIEYWSSVGEAKKFSTLFLGGGTPSLLHSDVLMPVLEKVQSKSWLSQDAEITVEANPETITKQKLSDLAAMGVNRLSVGIQTFDDKGLARLERKANSDTNKQALNLIAENWPGTWSLDLIFGTPEQNLSMWLSDLDIGLGYNPTHVSAYQLTLTTSRSQSWSQPPEDRLLEFFLLTEERLLEEGLLRYETSNFAQPGFESKHNLHYWRMNPFLGLGPGAYGIVDKSWTDFDRATQSGFHQRVAPRWETWLESSGDPTKEKSWLSSRTQEDHLKELLLMNLRLVEGMPLEKWGANKHLFENAATSLIAKGLLETFQDKTRGKVYRATTRGSQILDTVVELSYGLIDFDELVF